MNELLNEKILTFLKGEAKMVDPKPVDEKKEEGEEAAE